MAVATGHAPRLGFVGLGGMGGAMAARLQEMGCELAIHDLVPETGAALVAGGAHWHDSPAGVVSEASQVLLSLPGPPEVEAVVRGAQGLLGALPPGAAIVDLSTNSIAGVRALAEECGADGIAFLDAPVSGGIRGAREGTLILMVGGPAEALEEVRPTLERISRSILHFGESGAGSAAKLVHNQFYICSEVLFLEALVLAEKAGIAAPELVDLLRATGAGGVHAQLADRVLERRFDDGTFTLALAEKDVALALEAAGSLGVPTPASTAAHALLAEARNQGRGDENFWAAVETLEAQAGVQISARTEAGMDTDASRREKGST